MPDAKQNADSPSDNEAQPLFSLGLVMMLMGAGMSVLALLLMPYLEGPGRFLLVLGGLALTVALSWLAARQNWPGLVKPRQ